MRGARLPLVACAAALWGACASAPPDEPVPLQLDPVPLHATPTVIRDAATERYRELSAAVEDGNRAAAYAVLLDLVELCGTASLARRSLLLASAAELDPRGSGQRPALAVEYAALVLLSGEPDPWTRRVAEALYLLGQRLGGARPDPGDLDAQEIRWRVERAAERTPPRGCRADPVLAGAPPSPEEAEPSLPTANVSSYPVTIAELRRQVASLEQELERLRRISRP